MKTVLITGATSGIGKATAEAFARKGYRLIVCGRRQEKLLQLQNNYPDVDIFPLVFDVGNRQQVAAAFGSLPQEFSKIDVLVNNAGNAHGRAAIHEGDVDDWDAMINSNLRGLLYVTRAVLPGMVERKQGLVVNISSIAGKDVYQNGNVYCATKQAVEALSTGMRLDLNAHNIRVTNIAPGLVHTEFSNVRFKGDAEKAEQTYAGIEPLLAEDIADAIIYIESRPSRMHISDITILAGAQASASVVNRK